MTKLLVGVVALLMSTQGLAQSGPPGGGPPPGGGNGPGGGPGGGAPPQMKPVKREKFDRAVTDMFHAADTNADGLVTIEEVRAIIAARRDKVIVERFARIDTNKDGAISRDEFVTWQRGLGSVALSEQDQRADQGRPIAEAIFPELGDKEQDALLEQLIEPISPVLIAQANSNYDAGLSLAELLVHEGKRFDEADRNKDGYLSMDEARGPDRPMQPGAGGPGGPGGAGGAPPPDR